MQNNTGGGGQNFMANLPDAQGWVAVSKWLTSMFSAIWSGKGVVVGSSPKMTENNLFYFVKKGEMCTPFNPKISFF